MKKTSASTSPVDARVDFFDRLAAEWDTIEQDSAETIEYIEHRAGQLGLRGGQRLLEVGCGTGQLTGWLVERVRPGRVTAVDFSAEMLRKAASKGIDAEFRRADACADDLGRAEYDVAFCFHSFPHFRDQRAALRNLARCLKPRGRLIVLHVHGREEVNAFHGEVGGEIGGDTLPSDNQWRRWLKAAGFDPPDISDAEDGFFLQARHFAAHGTRTRK